jgi:cell wall-associated NlpC family hydrolase
MSKLVNLALEYVGYPAIKYRSPSEGKSPQGFDCSGFVQYCLLKSGYDLHANPLNGRLIRHSEEFLDWFGIMVHEKAKKPGDLIFFSRNGFRPNHVGIYLGDDHFIHSQGKDSMTVDISHLDERNGIKFNPSRGKEQIYYKNPIAYKRPVLESKVRFERIYFCKKL